MSNAGRPSEYKPEYIEKVDEYLSRCEDYHEEFHKTRGAQSDSYERVKVVRLPKVEEFAAFIGVSKSTVYYWAESNPEFSDALEKILDAQKNKLIDKGLSGEYNSTIAKLMLSSNHGMAEKTESKNEHIVKPLLGGESTK